MASLRVLGCRAQAQGCRVQELRWRASAFGFKPLRKKLSSFSGPRLSLLASSGAVNALHYYNILYYTIIYYTTTILYYNVL